MVISRVIVFLFLILSFCLRKPSTLFALLVIIELMCDPHFRFSCMLLMHFCNAGVLHGVSAPDMMQSFKVKFDLLLFPFFFRFPLYVGNRPFFITL